MIQTECVYCNDPFFVTLDEEYLEMLKENKQLISAHTCESCGKVNYVEHRRMGGETFGEDDERAEKLTKLP